MSETLYDLGKRNPSKCMTFDYSCEISYLDRLLLLKVYKISAKKSIEDLCFMTLKSDAKLEEKLIWFRNEEKLLKFDLITQNSQKFYFDWFLLCKVFKVWPKKVQRSYLWWHWRKMQNLKKNRLVIWNTTWGIWQIFTRALESLKIGALMGSFNPK